METANLSASAAHLAEVFNGLIRGDLVEVTTAAGTRRVRVESTGSTAFARYVYTTSGAVRPGHRAGGALRLDRDGSLTFQPTMAQQQRVVVSLSSTPIN